MLNCYVKFYKISNNGEVLVETNATDPQNFLQVASAALEMALGATEGDVQYTLSYALPAIVELACKLKGYKTDGVAEQRVLLSGSVWPGADAEVIGSYGLREERPAIPAGVTSE